MFCVFSKSFYPKRSALDQSGPERVCPTEYFEKLDTRIERLEQPILEPVDDIALQRF